MTALLRQPLLCCTLLLGACHPTPAPASPPVSITNPAPVADSTPASDFAFASGGLRLEYSLEADPDAPADALKQAQAVVKRRLDALGVQVHVSVIGKHLVVDVPGTPYETMEGIRDVLAIGKLEIRELDDSSGPADKLPPGTLELPATMLDDTTKIVRLRPGGIGPAHVEDAEPRMNEMGAAVDIRFNAAGTAAFAQLSRDNLNKQLAIVLGDKILAMPIVKTPILDGRLTITMGSGDEQTQLAIAQALVRALKAGALHGKLVLESEYTVPARK